MKTFRRTTVAALTVLSLGGGPAMAHHAFGMFDSRKTVALEGAVKEFQWTNPHIWVQLQVKQADGSQVDWSIEGASPNVLARQGWSRQVIKAGDKAVIVVHPLKDGSAGGSLVSATVNGMPIGRPG